jgi:hypothetical protein
MGALRPLDSETPIQSQPIIQLLNVNELLRREISVADHYQYKNNQ